MKQASICADEDRGLCMEVGCDTSQHTAMVLRSFVSSAPLEAYAHWVRPQEG